MVRPCKKEPFQFAYNGTLQKLSLSAVANQSILDSIKKSMTVPDKIILPETNENILHLKFPSIVLLSPMQLRNYD